MKFIQKSCLVFISLHVVFLVSVSSGQRCIVRELGSKDVIRGQTPPSCALPVSQINSGLYRPLVPPTDSLFPPWYNATLFRIGQKFAQKHFLSVLITQITALPLFTNHPLIKPLLKVSRKSSTTENANRRFLSTILHVKLYYEQEGAALHHVIESLVRTQGIHFSLARNYTWAGLEKSNCAAVPKPTDFSFSEDMWAAVNADLEASKIPEKHRFWSFADLLPPKDGVVPLLNQLSFSNTQFFLGGLYNVIPKRVGIHDAKEEEMEGFNHLWAVLGFAVGIEDHFNIALQPSGGKLREYYRQYYDEYMLPALFHRDADGKNFMEGLYTGFIRASLGKDGDKMFRVEQMMLLGLENVFGVDCPNIRKRLGLPSRFLRSNIAEVTNMFKSASFRKFLAKFVLRTYVEKSGRNDLGIDINDPFQVAGKSYF